MSGMMQPLGGGSLFVVRDTERTGLGLFARQRLAAGERAFEIEGPERVWRSVNDDDALANPNWICIGEHRWIDAVGAARFLNHSCEPNLAFREPREFVTLRAIKPGEELTFDYSLTEDEALWRMECRCGARSCRSVVRAIQFLPLVTFMRHQSQVTAYFRSVWERRHTSAKAPSP